MSDLLVSWPYEYLFFAVDGHSVFINHFINAWQISSREASQHRGQKSQPKTCCQQMQNAVKGTAAEDIPVPLAQLSRIVFFLGRKTTNLWTAHRPH